MRRLAFVVLLFLLWAPGAYAWTWPAQGPVLLGFTFDPSHPYAGGQHRGIDIGVGSGAPVVAPASGTVTFAGTVPTSGKSVTIATADGYSVTLTHLGSIAVSKGAGVAEGDAVGTVGPSGTPELDVPYVYMGVRVTAEAQGYLDPLSFLPALPPPVPVQPPPPPPPPAAPPAPPTVATAPLPAETTTTTEEAPPPPTETTTTEEAAPPAEATTAPVSDTDSPPPPTEATSEPTSGAGDLPAPPEATTETTASDTSVVPPPPDTAAPDTAPPAAETPAPEPVNAPAPPPAPPVPTVHVIDADPGFDPTAASADEAGPVPADLSAPSEPAPATGVAPPPVADIPVDDAFVLHPPVVVFVTPLPLAVVAAAAAPVVARHVHPPAPVVPRRPDPGPAAPRARRVHRVPIVAPAPRVRPRRAPGVPLVVRGTHRRRIPWLLVTLLALGCAAGVKAVRMISSSSQPSEGARTDAAAEDPRRGRLAVRQRPAAPGPCRRPGRAVRHLRALSPPQGQRRRHGERDGRARHAGDGVGRPRGRVSS
jgi:hypothetical protein